MESIEIAAHRVSKAGADPLALVRLTQMEGGGWSLYAYRNVDGEAFERRGNLFRIERDMSIWRMMERATAWVANEAEKD